MATTLGALMRDAGAAAARKRRGPSRQGLATRQRRATGIPAYLAEFRLIPGSCAKRRCKSRYGVIRLSIDTRSRERIDTVATVECASCGRTWRRTRTPKLTEYQSTRLTLILPATLHRWYSRGHWHTEGSDALVIRDAAWSDLIEAQADWKRRNGQLLDAKARRAAKKAEAEAALHAKTLDTLAKLTAFDAAREAEEAAAAARDAA